MLHAEGYGATQGRASKQVSHAKSLTVGKPELLLVASNAHVNKNVTHFL